METVIKVIIGFLIVVVVVFIILYYVINSNVNTQGLTTNS